MHKLKIRKVGNSLGLTLPKEVLGALRVSEGEELVLTETQDGFVLSRHEVILERGMKAYERTRRKYRNAFRELSK